MTNQRIRNLSTGRLHTQMSDVYDPQHDGETALPPMTLDEQEQFWYLYESL